MKHQVKVTIVDKKLYPNLRKRSSARPAKLCEIDDCSLFRVGDEYVFKRDGERDDFWRKGLNTLTQTSGASDTVAGGPALPFCLKAWDVISHYIYAGLQGEPMRTRVLHCNNPTRPVFFKIERIDCDCADGQ